MLNWTSKPHENRSLWPIDLLSQVCIAFFCSVVFCIILSSLIVFSISCIPNLKHDSFETILVRCLCRRNTCFSLLDSNMGSWCWGSLSYTPFSENCPHNSETDLLYIFFIKRLERLGIRVFVSISIGSSSTTARLSYDIQIFLVVSKRSQA